MERFDEIGARFMVGGVLVDSWGKPVEQPAAPAPFDAFSETVRASLEAEGVRTHDDLKGKTKEDLVALKGVGEATAADLLKLAPAE